MKKCSNKDVKYYVDSKELFVANNIFSSTISSEKGDFYVIYSYGWHFPMYAFNYKTNTWFVNKDKYSVTTSKHQTQAKPSDILALESAEGGQFAHDNKGYAYNVDTTTKMNELIGNRG